MLIMSGCGLQIYKVELQVILLYYNTSISTWAVIYMCCIVNMCCFISIDVLFGNKLVVCCGSYPTVVRAQLVKDKVICPLGAYLPL